MMAGKFKEYNWGDILRLIYADAGLVGDVEQRQRGDLRYVGKWSVPEHVADTCVRLSVYDKDAMARLEEHVEGPKQKDGGG